MGLFRTAAKSTSPKKKLLFLCVPGCGAEIAIKCLKHALPSWTFSEFRSDIDRMGASALQSEDIVYGSLSCAQALDCFPDRELVTVLREPLERLLSHASSNPQNGLWSPEKYLQPDWPMAHYLELATTSQIGTLAEALSVNERFLFVGLFEYLRSDLLDFLALLGEDGSLPAEEHFSKQQGDVIQDSAAHATGMPHPSLASDRFHYHAAVLTRNSRRIAPFVKRGVKPRVAFVSPLPPAEFGVPSYSAETVKALAQFADVTVVAGPNLPHEISRQVVDILSVSNTTHLNGFDMAYFVYGNHPHHLDAVRIAMGTSNGTGIYHDAQQLDFARFALGDLSVRALATAGSGQAVTQKDIDTWHATRHWLPYPMLEPAVSLPHNAIVHSPIQSYFHASYYGKVAHYVPVAIQHRFSERELASDSLLRAKLRCGLHEKELHIGTFGFVQREKQVDLCISALRHLTDWGINAHLWFVGGIDDATRNWLMDVAVTLDLEQNVHFSGRISERQYCDFLLAMDFAVQLRRPLFGQLSGALLDCVSAGLPTVANTSLIHAIEAPSFVSSIKDEFTSIDLAEVLMEIVARHERCERSHTEWRPYIEQHSFRQYAQRLLSLI